jgi:hypothetical protein
VIHAFLESADQNQQVSLYHRQRYRIFSASSLAIEIGGMILNRRIAPRIRL